MRKYNKDYNLVVLDKSTYEKIKEIKSILSGFPMTKLLKIAFLYWIKSNEWEKIIKNGGKESSKKMMEDIEKLEIEYKKIKKYINHNKKKGE